MAHCILFGTRATIHWGEHSDNFIKKKKPAVPDVMTLQTSQCLQTDEQTDTTEASFWKSPMITDLQFMWHDDLALLFDSLYSTHGFSLIPSKWIKPDIQNIHGLLSYHFPNRHSRILPTEKRYWAYFCMRNLYIIHAFYSAILTSCYHHVLNNVKEARNSGDLVPKMLTL